ncbi:MAG: hypothetical protein IJI73_02710, partial [Kiritimatiellae bacterium]|nr:hypothetical protein [Kiritimatiellia bacterium]
IFMIDDTWQHGYGEWDFDRRRFDEPKGMMDRLHAMGFKVLLWMCPFVSMDTPAFRRVAFGKNPDDVNGYPAKGGFLVSSRGRGPYGQPPVAPVNWWNGTSALLDFTHPNAVAWFDEQLGRLVRDYGADGFKFDGGGVHFYAGCVGLEGSSPKTFAHDPSASPAEQSALYGNFALKYRGSEYRNVFGFAGKPVIMRLHDKPHTWDALRRLVPDMLAAGFVGCPFICPDMIGGGEWTAFLPGAPFEPELFIRSAQVHALCPMMQISASPWRVLSPEHQAVFRKVADLRQRFAPRFVELAKESARTGEPMMRNLEYCFPGTGCAEVKDEFMMGDGLLVAPVMEKGATSRTVVLPPGRWLADDGKTYNGPAAIEVDAPLERLPHFERLPATPWVSEEERASVAPAREVRFEGVNEAGRQVAQRVYTNETGFALVSYDESKAGEPGRDWELPDPLVFADGRKVANAADWAARRKEILGIFEREVYGRMPPKPDAMVFDLVSEKVTEDRFALERRYRQWFRADRSGPFVDWLVLVPRYAKKPCPVILHLNYRDNDFTATGRTNHFQLPLGEFAAKGYAYMSALYTQIASDGPDKGGDPFNGVFELWGARDPARTDNTGTLMAWAWGLCRGLDLADGIDGIDASRSMVIGSSRLGKAALLAAAYDERFKVCVANQTGAIGVQLLRRGFGENLRTQRFMFPWWYCSGVWKWAGREREMPFDQHMLLACVAPRALLVEGFDRPWFDPRGEWLSVKAASPVWELLAGKGVACADWTAPYDGSAARPPLGYARRTEEHGLAPHDWSWAIDFADAALK